LFERALNFLPDDRSEETEFWDLLLSVAYRVWHSVENFEIKSLCSGIDHSHREAILQNVDYMLSAASRCLQGHPPIQFWKKGIFMTGADLLKYTMDRLDNKNQRTNKEIFEGFSPRKKEEVMEGLMQTLQHIKKKIEESNKNAKQDLEKCLEPKNDPASEQQRICNEKIKRTEFEDKKMDGKIPKTPQVRWAQRKDKLILKVEVEAPKNTLVDIVDEKILTINSANHKNEEYSIRLDLTNAVTKKGIQVLDRQRYIEIDIKKKEVGPYWNRLIVTKSSFIKVDWESWKQEEEEEEEDGEEEEEDEDIFFKRVKSNDRQ